MHQPFAHSLSTRTPPLCWGLLSTQIMFCMENTCLLGITSPHRPAVHTPRLRIYSQDQEDPFPTCTERNLSPDRNLDRMIWERWEEAARVIAKAGMGTWAGWGGGGRQGQSGGQEASPACERSREGPEEPREGSGLRPYLLDPGGGGDCGPRLLGVREDTPRAPIPRACRKKHLRPGTSES